MDIEDNRNHAAAFKAKELVKRGSRFHLYLGELLFYEWHDFAFWWQNPLEASGLVQQKDGETQEDENLLHEELVELKQALPRY